jgi:hypothetical protein
VGGSSLTAIKSSLEKKGYVKNLTFEQNIQQISENHIESLRHNTASNMGVRPEDLFLTNEELGSLFSSVRDGVVNSQDGLRIGLHLYGLNMPIGYAISDFGDHRITISVDDKPFNTIEGIRNYLVGELIGGNEVYVYSVNVVKFFDPTDFQPTRRFYIRCSSIHRSRWVQMTNEAETNRDLPGRLPYDHNINTNGFNDTVVGWRLRILKNHQ